MQENAVWHRLGARWARARALVCASATVAGLLLMAGCGGSGATGPATGLDTLDPGVLRVAAQSYMPYSAIKGPEIVGLDGEILQHVADRLDLKIEPQLTDFNGMLGGVQSHRVDITIGGVAWTKERASQGLFTDPPYYSPPAMGVASGRHYATVEDLAGQRLGTVTGYVWVKSIQAVPGAKLHAYPSALGVFDDLASGRLDVGFLDPLLIIYYQKQRPDRPMQTEYLTPPTAAEIKQHPAYDYFGPTDRLLHPQAGAEARGGDLARDPRHVRRRLDGDADQEVRAATRSSSSSRRPRWRRQRRGVDRPANWTPPSL